MSEKQGIYNIEKQEARRDIFNIVIQHLATGKKANLPSIQYALRKGETTKGAFFKNEPEWVDFEQGYIVERKEVSEIIKNLENEKVQLVLGAPASGKSIILKNVGYKLANQNKSVHIVELKKHQIEEVKLYFEAIPEINNDNTIYNVDDAHLYPSECEKLIRDFKSGGKGKLIIGSRPTEEILPAHPKKTSEFQFLNKTEIEAEDVTEEMIRTFLKIRHGFNDDRIKTVSDNLTKYKKDLWQLSWALNAYNPEKDSVDDEEIYENIMVSITEIETKDRKKISGEDVFLPLAVFYRYEIQIERKFLEKQLGIKKETIEQLIGLSEIVETVEKGKPIMLSLHHSSIAKLYFRAYQNYPSFGEEIKDKILNQRGKEDLEYCSFYHYITTTEPRNAIEVMIYVGNYWFDVESGSTLLIKKLTEEDRIQEIIVKGIEKEENISKIGECLGNIAWASKDIGLKLPDSISIDAFSSKINKVDDIEKVGLCVITDESEKVAMKLANNIDINALSSKIDKEEDIEKVWSCVSGIAGASNEAGLKLLECIDINALSSKINNEEDIEKVRLCVSSITRISEEVALKLADIIDINSIIEKGENLVEIGTFMESIANANINFETKISEKYDVNLLSSKIEENKRIEDVGWFVGRKVNKYLAMKLLDNVIKRIEIEEDIEKIGSCVWEFSRGNKEITLKMVDKIDIYAISSKIEKEEDIGKIGSCVIGIAEANEDLGLNLINNIDIYALESKIEKEEDIRKIGGCVQGFARANEDLGLKLINGIDLDTLALKVDKEENIEMIGAFVDTIAMGSEEAGLKLANNINIETLVSKIEDEDIEKIKRCLSGISRANKEVANKIINRLNPKLREELGQRIHF